nr:neurofilament heavy polypeptide-like [Penaeus vannamei]
MAAFDGSANTSNSTLDFPAACFSADCSPGGCCHGGGERGRPEGKHDVNRKRPEKAQEARGKGIVLAPTERRASKCSENTSGSRNDDKASSGSLCLADDAEEGEARVPSAAESPGNAPPPGVGSPAPLVCTPSKSRVDGTREIPAMAFLRTDASDVYSCLLAQVLSRGRPRTPSTQRNTAEALATPARASAGLPFGDRCPCDPSAVCLTRGRTEASRQNFVDRTTFFSVRAVRSACKSAPPSPVSPGPSKIAFCPAGSGSSAAMTDSRRPATQPAFPRVPECFNPETPTEGVQSAGTTTGRTSARDTKAGMTSARSPTAGEASTRSTTAGRTSTRSPTTGRTSKERTSSGRKSPGRKRKTTLPHPGVLTELALMNLPASSKTPLGWWFLSRRRLPKASGRGLLAWCLWVGVWASLLVGGASVIPSSNTTFALQKYQADRARCLGPGRCDETCPPDFYKHEDNGCLTEEECLNLHQLLYHTSEGNYCVIACPKHYETEGNTCRKSGRLPGVVCKHS